MIERKYNDWKRIQLPLVKFRIRMSYIYMFQNKYEYMLRTDEQTQVLHRAFQRVYDKYWPEEKTRYMKQVMMSDEEEAFLRTCGCHGLNHWKMVLMYTHRHNYDQFH